MGISRDEESKSRRNYNEESAYSGSFCKFNFLKSKEELLPGLTDITLLSPNFVFFYGITMLFITFSSLFSSLSHSCFRISTIKEFSPCKIRSLILASNTILKSSKDNQMKFQFVSLTVFVVSSLMLSKHCGCLSPLLFMILLTIIAILKPL